MSFIIDISFDGSEYYSADLTDVTADMWAKDPWGRDWFTEVEEWCDDTFGPQDMWGEPVVSGWKRMRGKYFFTSEDKRNLFLLRWS